MEKREAKDDLRQRLEQLRQLINYHNYQYHVLDTPVISDYEYDQLMTELRSIEGDHPEWVTPDSPSQRVGGEPEERFKKVQHPAPILSLANAFGEDDIRAWYERILKLDDRVEQAEYVVQPKMDGLTVVLHYQDGRFVQGATRGDGYTGEDITANLRTIRALPLTIPISPDGPLPPRDLSVRGEAFIMIDDFKALNKRLEEAGEKTYLNPRNTAAGSLRQLDPALTDSRPLTLQTYEIVYSSDPVPATQYETIEYLSQLGFPVVENTLCDNLDAAILASEDLTSRREILPFEADGAVIKINDIGLASDLGVVGKDPRGAIAFKFPAVEVTTK
jgi:DNA ligase (NAD+)